MCVDTSNRHITKDWFKTKSDVVQFAHKILFVKVIYIDKSHGSIKAMKLSGEFKGENLELFKHEFPYTTNYQVHEEFKIETVK